MERLGSVGLALFVAFALARSYAEQAPPREGEPGKGATKDDIRKEVDEYLKVRGGGAAAESAVNVGTGKLKIGGLLKVWFTAVQNDGKTVTGGVNEANDNDTFRIRNAQIQLSGQIVPEVRYTVMVDAARGIPSAFPIGRTTTGTNATTTGYSSEILQDAYIELDFIKWHTIWIGQGKRPIGRETGCPNARMPLPERAMLSLDAGNGNARDAGIKIVGEYKETPLDWFTWQFGVFNGAGFRGQSHQNRFDDNDEKDFIERIVVRVLGKQGAFLRDSLFGDLELGFSRLDGKQGETRKAVTASATTLGVAASTWHYSMGFDLEYRVKLGEHGGLWLLGEWFESSARPAPAINPVTEQIEQRTNQHGWYAMIGYRLGGTDCKHLDDKLEFLYRYEDWANIFCNGLAAAGRGTEWRTRVHTAGVTYYIKGHNAKVQAAYDWIDEPDDDRGAGKRGLREVRNNTFRLSVQTMF